jgi:hypothetical protein
MIVLAIIVTAIPITIHLASQTMAITICALLAFMITNFATTSLPIILIFSYLFQNLFVALVSPHITGIEQLNSIRAYNFIITIVTWMALATGYWLERGAFDRRMRLLMDVTTGALGLTAIYFVIGAASSPGNAVVYLRNIATPLLLLQIFALAAYRCRISLLKPFTIIAILACAYGYVEMFAQQDLLRLVNGDVYMNWRIRQDYEAGVWLRELLETGRVMRRYFDALAIDFLNTPLLSDMGLRLYRLVGPNFHSISFAYALAFLAIVLTAGGRWWWSLLVLPLLLVIGSKGALISLLLVLVFLVLFTRVKFFKSIGWYGATLVVYATAGILIGIQSQDYHVLGLIGGLRGFVSNPFGHGIGAGGNLSLNVAALDWSRSQHIGHTDIAVESAVGVLLYQMGVAGLFVLTALGWIVLALWRQFRLTHQTAYAAAALGIGAITVNGIFQEEALFAPLALGMMCALAGLMLGSAYRTGSAASGSERSVPVSETGATLAAAARAGG